MKVKSTISVIRSVIDEVLEDISLYGLEEPCILLVNQNGEKDYLLKSEYDEVAYIDETRHEMTLFQALIYMVVDLKILQYGEDPGLNAAFITSCRLVKGESQKEFSNALGIPLRSLEDWERGNRVTRNIATIYKIADYSGVNADKFIRVIYQ